MEKGISFDDGIEVFINGKPFCCCAGIEVTINPLEQKQVKICFDADKVIWNSGRVEIYDDELGACLSQEDRNE